MSGIVFGPDGGVFLSYIGKEEARMAAINSLINAHPEEYARLLQDHEQEIITRELNEMNHSSGNPPTSIGGK